MTEETETRKMHKFNSHFLAQTLLAFSRHRCSLAFPAHIKQWKFQFQPLNDFENDDLLQVSSITCHARYYKDPLIKSINSSKAFRPDLTFFFCVTMIPSHIRKKQCQFDKRHKWFD